MSLNTYYCYIKLNSIERALWSSPIIMQFTFDTHEMGKISPKPCNGMTSQRKFRFDWNSRMSKWTVEFFYKNKLGDQTFTTEIPIGSIVQDLTGGQVKVIPLNNDLGSMTINISENEFIPPTAVSFCDHSQIGIDGLFFTPVQSVDTVRHGSIIANNISNPKKLIIAVDLTGSNGNVADRYGNPIDSLHHLDPEKNSYRKAIVKFSDLVSILCPDSTMPILGFGHEFKKRQLAREYCENFSTLYWPTNGPVGCGASIQCYDKILENLKTGDVKLSGGTTFVPVISSSEKLISNELKEHCILLFFSDGEAEDYSDFVNHCIKLEKTKNVFTSIILVIVGKNKDKIVNSFKGHKNILVFGQIDLDSGSIYKTSMDWIENRSSIFAKN